MIKTLKSKSNPLIGQLHRAVKEGFIVEPFTQEVFEKWIYVEKIVKGDGKNYKRKSIKSILRNSDMNKRRTKNTNSRWLIINAVDGVRYHRFV